MRLKIIYDTAFFMTALDNAGIFNGENEGYGWSSHFKQNNSAVLTGPDFPNNDFSDSINIINDNDHIDAWINDQDRVFGFLGEHREA